MVYKVTYLEIFLNNIGERERIIYLLAIIRVLKLCDGFVSRHVIENGLDHLSCRHFIQIINSALHLTWIFYSEANPP